MIPLSDIGVDLLLLADDLVDVMPLTIVLIVEIMFDDGVWLVEVFELVVDLVRFVEATEAEVIVCVLFDLLDVSLSLLALAVVLVVDFAVLMD